MSDFDFFFSTIFCTMLISYIKEERENEKRIEKKQSDSNFKPTFYLDDEDRLEEDDPLLPGSS
jgi:hypothetical protein